MKQLTLMCLSLFLCSCAVTNETSLVVGKQRPAITPDQVEIYIEPPQKYEVIALITADAAHDFMSKC